MSASSRLRAPRSLNDAVNWKLSSFTTTVQPRISESVLLTGRRRPHDRALDRAGGRRLDVGEA